MVVNRPNVRDAFGARKRVLHTLPLATCTPTPMLPYPYIPARRSDARRDCESEK